MELIDFTHPVLNEEIRAIGGHYFLARESRLPFKDGEVLYFIGCAVVNSSCCGIGGCAYAQVPGYIKQWKYKFNSKDLPVSQVQPVRNKDDQEQLRRLIQQKEHVQQVNFIG